MTGAVMQRDVLMPREPGGMGPGLLLALLVHALLVVALAIGVSWHASEPEGVSAELWAMVPQVAAPKAVEPAPAPVQPKPEPTPEPKPAPPQATQAPDAQIAIERARKEELERKKRQAEELAQQQRLEQEEKRKQLEDKRRKQLEEQRQQERLAALHDQQMKRIMGQAGATGEPGSTGTAERTAGPSANYAGRIKARIKPNIIFGDTLEGNPLATVKIRLSPDGTIVGKDWVKRSGVPSWDEAVMRAIDKTAVLPRDIDGRVPSSMEIDFRPRD